LRVTPKHVNEVFEQPERPSKEWTTMTSQSLERGLRILTEFTENGPVLGIADLARAVGLNRSTTHRYVATLAGLGFLQQDPETRKYSLGPRVADLGFAAISSMEITGVAAAHLQTLSDETGCAASMAVLDGADIVYVARVPTRRIMSVRITIGTRFPAYATSMGRVLLAEQPDAAVQALLTASAPQALTERTLTDAAALRAELARVREQGWALVDGELEPGLRSVAVPVRDRRGEVVAAVNVSTSATRDTVEHVLDAYLPRLQAAATAIDAELRLI
jgi:IclR family transcriptional regulator, pca regulon regulatory protein